MAALPHALGNNAMLGPDPANNRLPAKAALVFRLLPVHPCPDVSPDAIAALANLSLSESHTALACLAQAHLIEVVPGAQGRWRLSGSARVRAERLSDAFAAADEREQARDRLLEYYLIAAEAADDRLRELPPVLATEEFTDRNGALAWLDSERPCLVAAIRMAADKGRDEAAKSLPLLMAYYLGFRGLFDDLLAVSTTSVQAARRLGDRAAESEALTNFGVALYGLRRYDEAVIAHRDAAAIVRRAGDRHAEGEVLNNLGLALHGLARNDEAVIAHRDAAAIFHQAGDRYDEGKALNNLGLALHGLARNDEAVIAHRDAAGIFRRVVHQRDEASALANLGNALQELGLSAEAIAAYHTAVNLFRDVGDYRSELMAQQSLDLTRETT
jgi:tetratricopeptide (TPR) repeat protein